jgi:photosystem II stability/assembly factor-like uncharacterized protein
MKSYKQIITGLFCMFTTGFLAGQDNPWTLWQNPGTDDFETIRLNVENYYADKDKTARGSGYKQWKRWEYIQQDRLTNDGKLMNYAAKNFQEFQAYTAMYGSRGITSSNGEWESLGPDYFVDGFGWNGGIGRVNCIAFHPTDPDIIWIGCPAGGLWKTTTGGTSWTPLTDGMPRIGVSGIAVNYNDPDVMYILTGDGDGADVYSIGVLKTTDGGSTWNSTGLTWAVTDFERGFKIIMHPVDPSILLVVSSAGIHKSPNSGANWNLVHSSAGSDYHDIEFKPGDPTIMYACAGSKFYRSTNTGDTWTQITSGVPVTATRMAIGVRATFLSDVVYLLAGPSYSTGTFVGLFRSLDSGLSFGTQSTTPNILGYSATGADDADQATYDLCIAVPWWEDTFLIGAINCWYSPLGGITWTLSSMWNNPPGPDYTHADIHALEINPLNNYVYCGSDGGFFRSVDFGNNWTDLSDGLAITQYYCIAGYEPNTNLITSGTQDNGSNIWTGGTTMLHVLGADGMDCMIDHSNPAILYNSIQFGDLRKSVNSGASYSVIKPAGSVGSWVTPYVMHVVNPLIIYGGYSDIYRSTDGGASWSNLGSNGSGAMALGGPSHPDRLYASVDNSNQIVTTGNGLAPFTTITSNLPAGNITGIAVNPANASDVFVTFGGYDAANKVYRSTNAGASWNNITGTLPNIPVNCIAYELNGGSPNDPLYIGTDIGVFYRNDDIGDWIPFMNGLPATMVFDLEINEANGIITAATYGRSLWRSDLYSYCPVSLALTPANDPSNPNYTGFQLYEAESTISSSRIITGGIGTDVTYRAGSVTLVPGFKVYEGNHFKATQGYCSGSNPFPCGIPVTFTHVAGPVAPVDKTTTYGTVDGIPGEPTKCWITSNLGSDQQATAVDDATEASAGWYWQFNRMQGYKHDGGTLTPGWTITGIDEYSDWVASNDPCSIELGSNWRIPTSSEFLNVISAGGWTDWIGPWSSPLRLHAAGSLDLTNGGLFFRGSGGRYFSSTQTNNISGYNLGFGVGNCLVYGNSKAYGFSVRCISE